MIMGKGTWYWCGELVPRMQGWFSTYKSILMIHHFNRMKEEGYIQQQQQKASKQRASAHQEKILVKDTPTKGI